MIQINGKDVSQIRVGNKIITAVYIGTKLVPLFSCLLLKSSRLGDCSCSAAILKILKGIHTGTCYRLEVHT